MPPTNNTILDASDLTVRYPTRWGLGKRAAAAVEGVSFSIRPGQTLGLIGESGSGKTTIGRAALRLVPGATVQGQVIFAGQDLLAASPRQLRSLRRRMQIIFQDAGKSLNPRLTTRNAIEEPLITYRLVARRQRPTRVGQLLERVGLPASFAARYPHELSGGQQQRVAIARALATQPDLIVCDEPASALDVSVQAQILDLLKDLQADLGLSYLFISHDLAVINHMADRTAVLFRGRLVEAGPTADLLNGEAAHPYTQMLLACALRQSNGPVDRPWPEEDKPTGCAFHRQCPHTRAAAATHPPQQRETVVTLRGSFDVVHRCAREQPHLAAQPGRPGHLHACLLRQAPTDA